MSRAMILAAVALGAISAAAPALAQDRAERPPLRRLDWAGRPADTSGGRAASAQPVAMRGIIPHAGAPTTRVALRPAQPWRPSPGGQGRYGLTTADAFTGGAVEAAPVWTAPPEPQPTRQPQPQPQPQRAASAPQPQAPAPVRTQPAPAPVEQPRARLVEQPPVAPQPQPQRQPQPEAQADVVDDPMAPRRDAPIFRLQRAPQAALQPMPQLAPQPAPQATAGAGATPTAARDEPQAQAWTQAPPPPRQQGARYYSVHRQAGRQPDPMALPEPVWLDRMPVELESTPQSEDLAGPPETPQMVRGADGKLRPVQGAQHDLIP